MASSPITLHRLTPETAHVLDTVAADVFDQPLRPDWIAAYLRSEGHVMVLALDGDLVVGQVAAVVHRHPSRPDELYVDEVGTATSHLRRGIATAMMAEMFAWGRELGCIDAWLGTETDNLEANGLYRKIGGRLEHMVYYEFDLRDQPL